MIVYISIGNSDDKLSQWAWANYVMAVDVALMDARDAPGSPVSKRHGVWQSASASHWQNACWCVEVTDPDELKDRLRELAGQYGQDSIAWAEAPTTEFLAAT
jgi:hypothetical protein